VNLAQAQQLARKGAAARAEVSGLSVAHKTSILRVPVSSTEDALNLETGGFERAVTLRFRFPASYPPPAKGDTLTVTATGVVYVVTHSQDLPPGALSGDYIVEAKRR